MKSKLFLTSLTAIAIAMPAMAEDFPSSGLMQENKTYTEAANHDNMGVYEGTVTANAEYDWNIITVNPGQYIPANSTTAATCTAGNYCLGMTSNQQDHTPHYSDTVQGLSQCPANYSNSAAGADAATDCYRTCTTTDVAHSANVTGMMYYDGTSGDGVNACEPTDCVAGWHLKQGLDLTSTIGTSEGESGAYINNNGQFSENSAAHGQSYYGINGNNTWAVDYGNGIIHGHAACSTTPGTADWKGANSTFSTETNIADETGQEGARYCYCSVTGYKDGSGNLQSVSSSWVYAGDLGTGCADQCAYDCSDNMGYGGSGGLAFRAAVLGAVGASPAMCEANTITINWAGATAEAISANNAGTATYDGDIRTPQSAIPVTGKTFKGWRFEKPTPSQGD